MYDALRALRPLPPGYELGVTQRVGGPVLSFDTSRIGGHPVIRLEISRHGLAIERDGGGEGLTLCKRLGPRELRASSPVLRTVLLEYFDEPTWQMACRAINEGRHETMSGQPCTDPEFETVQRTGGPVLSVKLYRYGSAHQRMHDVAMLEVSRNGLVVEQEWDMSSGHIDEYGHERRYAIGPDQMTETNAQMRTAIVEHFDEATWALVCQTLRAGGLSSMTGVPFDGEFKDIYANG